MAKRPLSEISIPAELLALVDASIAREGTTSADGAALGDSFIDAGLIGFGADSFEGMLAVIRPGEPNLIDSHAITAFDNVTGEVTLGGNYKGGQIAADTPYTIITMKGTADTATLETWVGWQGATSLADKLTLARAALLDQITALRMAQLDPAGLETDINDVGVAVMTRAAPGDAMGLLAATIVAIRQSVTAVGDPANSIGKALYDLYITRLTAARALLLDEITALRMAQLDPAGLEADIAVVDAAIAALNDISADDVRQSVCLVGDPANSIGRALYEIYVNRLTAARAAFLDAAISTRALEDGGRLQTTEGAVGAIEGATTLHNKLTAARAAFLDAAISSRAATGADMGLLAAAITAIRQSVTAAGDPANSIGKALYDLYVTRLTAVRAGYLDNINQAGLLQVTAARAGYLDNINQAGLLQVTAARAGYLDNINQAGLLQLTAARAGYFDRIKNLTRTQSGAQTITDAAAQVVGSAVEDTVPFKISGFISLHNLALNDDFLMLEEVRDRDDATYREYARFTYADVQTSPMVHFNEKVCQGWRVRMQRTAGANREITYQFFKEVQSA